MSGSETLASFLGSFVAVCGLVALAHAVGDKLTGIPARETPGSTIPNNSAKIVIFGLVGFLLGGLIGFLLRPAAPLVGQLDFGTVITRGSNLKGLDHLLVSTAETSFNYLLAGAILGALIGIAVGYFIFKKKETTANTAPI